MRNLGSESGLQVMTNFPDRYATGIQRDNDVIKTRQALLTRRQQTRFEAASPIPWLINLNRTNLGMNRFSRGAITRITATIPDPIMLVVT